MSLVQSIDWQSLTAYGMVLVVLSLMVYYVIKQFINFLMRREKTVMDREAKLMDLMDKQADAITAHTDTMRSIQENLRADRENVIKQVKRTENNIKSSIKRHAG